MISITTYWQQFKDTVNELQLLSQNGEFRRQIDTAKTLIEVGVTVETLGITEIKKIVNKLHEAARLFQHEVSFHETKDYKFYLPKIINTDTLIFAIIYHQHLTNYAQVEYQGSISWFRQAVVDGINEKKVTTRVQCKALLAEIEHYFKSQNIEINADQFLRQDNELIKDYIARLSSLFSPNNEPDNSPARVLNQSEELTKLEKSLEELKIKQTQLNAKIECFSEKLKQFNQTKECHASLNNEWQNKWLITRFFYRLISWLFTVPIIKDLENTQEQMRQAEQALNGESQGITANCYSVELKIEQEKINRMIQMTEAQKEQQTKLEQTKKEESQSPKSENTLVYSEMPQQEAETNNLFSNLESYYGFFKQHLPSPYVIQAATVAAAAISVQTLMG